MVKRGRWRGGSSGPYWKGKDLEKGSNTHTSDVGCANVIHTLSLADRPLHMMLGRVKCLSTLTFTEICPCPVGKGSATSYVEGVINFAT